MANAHILSPKIKKWDKRHNSRVIHQKTIPWNLVANYEREREKKNNRKWRTKDVAILYCMFPYSPQWNHFNNLQPILDNSISTSESSEVDLNQPCISQGEKINSVNCFRVLSSCHNFADQELVWSPEKRQSITCIKMSERSDNLYLFVYHFSPAGIPIR